MTFVRISRSAAVTATLTVLVACGGGTTTPSNPSPTPTPDPNPTGGTTITVTANGVSPREIAVSPGSRVTFINNDARPHEMNSDPHPDHTDCPEINQAGFLNQGQSRATGNLNTARTCGFHDHNNPDNAALQGRIIIR